MHFYIKKIFLHTFEAECSLVSVSVSLNGITTHASPNYVTVQMIPLFRVKASEMSYIFTIALLYVFAGCGVCGFAGMFFLLS